ncbi:MAG: hypothetical protein V4671_17795 [Armatimonadota bacterium]
MTSLYTTLDQRYRPEDVAQLVLEALGDQHSTDERPMLDRVARGSLKRTALGYTSLSQDFARPEGANRQVDKVCELFPGVALLTNAECDDPGKVEAFIRSISPYIRKTFGASDFKDDRLNQDARRVEGLTLSRRRYNKLFRVLVRMEEKLWRLVRERQKRHFVLIGKSGFASLLSFEDFSHDLDTGCFIAYYTARCNLRSEFTISGQQRPFDELCALLYARAKRSPKVNWRAIASVYPEAEVLEHLSDTEKGTLLGRWFSALQAIATVLHQTFERTDIDRQTMIVRRGNDSSTWNNTAAAWNKARSNWIALLYAMNMESLLHAICPGKVLKLMAADVVAWHRAAGGGLHPDVAVWKELPLPWEVVKGEAACGRALIEDVCIRNGVDPAKSGWIAPRPTATARAFRPTPELVHGVTVENPILATLLRQARYFSGKSLKYDSETVE